MQLHGPGRRQDGLKEEVCQHLPLRLAEQGGEGLGAELEVRGAGFCRWGRGCMSGSGERVERNRHRP